MKETDYELISSYIVNSNYYYDCIKMRGGPRAEPGSSLYTLLVGPVIPGQSGAMVRCLHEVTSSDRLRAMANDHYWVILILAGSPFKHMRPRIHSQNNIY